MGQGGPANAEYKIARMGEESHKRNQEAPVFPKYICIQDGSQHNQGYRRRNDLWAKGEGGACPAGT